MWKNEPCYAFPFPMRTSSHSVVIIVIICLLFEKLQKAENGMMMGLMRRRLAQFNFSALSDKLLYSVSSIVMFIIIVISHIHLCYQIHNIYTYLIHILDLSSVELKYKNKKSVSSLSSSFYLPIAGRLTCCVKRLIS